MGNVRIDPLKRVSFHCRGCGAKWQAEPSRVEEVAERAWHPWAYFATCERCGEEGEQAHWEKGMMASFGKHTGPRTPEGKAASAANLAGHPTPEEALRTRFNAMKHGLFAQTATFFPARPGGYPHCTGCDYLADAGCLQTPVRACLKRAELLLQHQVAFESGDPRMLTDLRARTQAMLQAIIDDIILAIVRRGVEIEAPQWYYDKDGCFHLAEYTNSDGEKILLTEVTQNPLLKVLGDLLSKNSMTLSDLEMTPKQQTQDTLLDGYLQQQGQERESALEHQRRQTVLLEQLQGQIDRSRERLARDPVLIEQQGEGDG